MRKGWKLCLPCGINNGNNMNKESCHNNENLNRKVPKYSNLTVTELFLLKKINKIKNNMSIPFDEDIKTNQSYTSKFFPKENVTVVSPKNSLPTVSKEPEPRFSDITTILTSLLKKYNENDDIFNFNLDESTIIQSSSSESVKFAKKCWNQCGRT